MEKAVAVNELLKVGGRMCARGELVKTTYSVTQHRYAGKRSVCYALRF